MKKFTPKSIGSYGCTITKMPPTKSYPKGCYEIKSPSSTYYEVTMAEAREYTKYLSSSWRGK